MATLLINLICYSFKAEVGYFGDTASILDSKSKQTSLESHPPKIH